MAGDAGKAKLVIPGTWLIPVPALAQQDIIPIL